MANRIAKHRDERRSDPLRAARGRAPKTVNNFVCWRAKGFYDGVIFHRVIKGFMVQGGDPTGTGGRGAARGRRSTTSSNARRYRGSTRGTLAMANAGPNTNGSQFFVMHADYPLPPSYTIFGRVARTGRRRQDRLGRDDRSGALDAEQRSSDGEGHDRGVNGER